MRTHRKGTDLKIEIRLALHSLGYPMSMLKRRLSIDELKQMLSALRREQLKLGIIKPR